MTHDSTEHASLVHLDKARAEIALVQTVEEVKDIRDKAEALRIYQKQVGAGLDIQNRCAEIKIRAERRAGEILKEMAETGERQTRGGDKKSNSTPTSLKLEDIGVSPDQSSAWQAIASIPEDEFEDEIEETKEKGKELTTAAMVRKAKKKPSEPRRPPSTPDWVRGKENDVVNDLVSSLQAITVMVKEKAKKWSADNRARVRECVDELRRCL